MATESFEFMLSHASDHTTFPAKVLTLASKVFWDSKDERGVWALADSGWRIVLKDHKDNILKQYLATFHSPRPAQIDNLFESLVGLKSLSSCWTWKGMTNDQARKKLDELINLRGAIAHRVSTSRSVQKDYFKKHNDFIVRLAHMSSNTVRSFVHGRVGKYPWRHVSAKRL